MYIYISIYTCVCTHMSCTYVHIYTHIRTYIHIFLLCLYGYITPHTHTHTYSHTLSHTQGAWAACTVSGYDASANLYCVNPVGEPEVFRHVSRSSAYCVSPVGEPEVWVCHDDLSLCMMCLIGIGYCRRRGFHAKTSVIWERSCRPPRLSSAISGCGSVCALTLSLCVCLYMRVCVRAHTCVFVCARVRVLPFECASVPVNSLRLRVFLLLHCMMFVTDMQCH